MAEAKEDTYTIPRQAKRTQLREEKPCTHPGCDRLQWSRGYCSRHYTRLKKSGVLESVKGPTTARRRFEASYIENPDTGCWEWSRTLNDQGYGVLPLNNRLVRAHRLSYLWHVGNIPPGAMILHDCDNPKCVNPDHLFLGDNALNMQDCVAKGRHASQSGTPYRALTPAMLTNIRIMFARGEISMRQLAAIYRVKLSTISNCLTGKTHLSPCRISRFYGEMRC